MGCHKPVEALERRRRPAGSIAEILPCRAVGTDTPLQHHLGAGVGVGLQQYRVHVGMGHHTCSLGLHHLRTPHFVTVGRDTGVVRHRCRHC